MRVHPMCVHTHATSMRKQAWSMCMYTHLETQTHKVQAQLIKIVKLATYHAYRKKKKKKKRTTQPKVKTHVLKQQRKNKTNK